MLPQYVKLASQIFSASYSWIPNKKNAMQHPLSQGGVNAAKKDLSCLRLPPVTHLEERNIMTMHGDLKGETRRA